MYYNRFFITGLLVLAACAGRTAFGEVLAQFTDPANPATRATVDITAASVEKSGTTLTFTITTSGAIPTSVADPCNITFIWFVNADNNMQTGQNPGVWGSEFNIRAVITHLGTGEAHIDTVGEMSGYGDPTVSVSGNTIRCSVDIAQIGNPDVLTFACDASAYHGPDNIGENGLTQSSGQAWVSNYAVVYSATETPYYSVDQNSVVYKCASEDPYNAATATIVGHDTYQNTDSSAQFNSLKLAGPVPGSDPEYFTHSTCSADSGHLRNLSYLNLNNPDVGLFGAAQTYATAGAKFMLHAKSGQTGAIPHGLYMLKINHDYLMRVVSSSEAWCSSYAQIVITDVDAVDQKLLWTDQRTDWTDKFSSLNHEKIDLANKGLKFETLYSIDWGMWDELGVNAPVNAAEITLDSTLSAEIEVNLAGDANNDRVVNFKDFAVLAANWLAQK